MQNIYPKQGQPEINNRPEKPMNALLNKKFITTRYFVIKWWHIGVLILFVTLGAFYFFTIDKETSEIPRAGISVVGGIPTSGLSGVDEFPIGLYCVNTFKDSSTYTNEIVQEFPAIVRAGFNWVQSYQFEAANYDLDHWNTEVAARKYLDAAHQNGLKVLMGLAIVVAEETIDQDLVFIQKRVNALKDHPALLGWQLYDEPDNSVINLVRPELLERAYQEVKRSDPVHPVTITAVETVRRDYPYFGGFDIAMPYEQSIPFAATVQMRDNLLQTIATLASVGKAAISHLSVGNMAKDRQSCPPDQAHVYPECAVNRYPTKEEIRFMAYDPVILGAKGVSFLCYRYSYDVNDPGAGDDISPTGARVNSQGREDPNGRPQWENIEAVSQELKSMSQILLQPNQNLAGAGVAFVGDNRIAHMLKAHEGKLYLFTANASTQILGGEFRFDPSRVLSPTITLIPQGTRISHTNGTITQQWAPYQVRIYEISPAIESTLTFQEGDGNAYSDTEDTYIVDAQILNFPREPQDRNYGKVNAISIFRPTFKGLVRFPGIIGSNPKQIPLGSVVSHATLRFKDRIRPSYAEITMTIYKALKLWGEGEGNDAAGGALAQSGEATWDSAQHGIQRWEVPGVVGTSDRSPAIDTATIIDDNGHITFDVTSVIQELMDGATNYGFVVISNNYGVVNELSSSEAANLPDRPLLTVTFTPPAPSR